MSDPQSLSEQDRADLVAYLDGELKGEAVRSLEARISRDPLVREEADSLKRAWDLLDYLPRPEPSPNFTHRTVSRIVPIRPGGIRLDWQRWRPYLFGAGWAAAVVLAWLGGMGAYRLIVPRQPGDAELVRDLRLIENKRLYEAGEDIEFIKQLDQPELFGDDHSGG
jgi:anti-sigma factor RsiW